MTIPYHAVVRRNRRTYLVCPICDEETPAAKDGQDRESSHPSAATLAHFKTHDVEAAGPNLPICQRCVDYVREESKQDPVKPWHLVPPAKCWAACHADEPADRATMPFEPEPAAGSSNRRASRG